MNRIAYVGFAFAGSIVALIGFFLPWYVEAFAPPNGFVIVNGIRVDAESYTANGLTVSYAHPYDAGPILRDTIIALFVIAIINLLQLYRFPGSNLLVSIIRYTLHAKFTYISLKITKVLLHIVQSVGWLAFIFLWVVLGQFAEPQGLVNQLGGGSNAVQVSHYLTIQFGIGYWLMGIGFAISIIGLFFRFAPDAAPGAASSGMSEGCINVVVACVMVGVVIFACVFHPFFTFPQPSQAAAHSTGIVKDGDFEQPALNSTPYREYTAGQTFGAWTVESGSINLVGTYWVAAHGIQSVVLSGPTFGAGTIYQDLSTKPGASYTLSFARAGDPGGGCEATVEDMQVWWGSRLVDMVSFNTKGHSLSNMGWETLSYKVQATSTVTRLRFVSPTRQTECSPALDDVAAE